jgi:hypothetical protein
MLQDECPDGIPRRLDGCKGTELTVLKSAQSFLDVQNRSLDSRYNSILVKKASSQTNSDPYVVNPEEPNRQDLTRVCSFFL